MANRINSMDNANTSNGRAPGLNQCFRRCFFEKISSLKQATTAIIPSVIAISDYCNSTASVQALRRAWIAESFLCKLTPILFFFCTGTTRTPTVGIPWWEMSQKNQGSYCIRVAQRTERHKDKEQRPTIPRPRISKPSQCYCGTDGVF